MRWVDHEERRRRIADVAIDVIAREGLSAATVRRIADEAGFSTTAVTHYFADKQELLSWTFEVLAGIGVERFEAVLAQTPGDIVGALMTMTASDAGTVRRWRAYLAFWDQAARDPQFAALHRGSTQAGLDGIARVVRARLGERADVAKISRLLSAVVQGISLQVLVEQDAWSEAKVRSLLDEEVEMVLQASRQPGPAAVK